MGEVHEVTERSAPIVAAAGRDRTVTVDPVLLFRFSALTYNAHRIHCDREFARAEGYPGLVVHGPLQALLMAELAGGGSEYAYRLVAPLYEDQGLIVSAAPDGDAVRVSCRDRSGRTTATGVLANALPPRRAEQANCVFFRHRSEGRPRCSMRT